MTYPELLQEIKGLTLEEMRSDSEESLELVISTTQESKLRALLESFFGVALKAAGKSPDEKSQKYAASHGGIQQNQTLYHAKKGESSFCAMIWPWGNKQSATVKIFRL